MKYEGALEQGAGCRQMSFSGWKRRESASTITER